MQPLYISNISLGGEFGGGKVGTTGITLPRHLSAYASLSADVRPALAGVFRPDIGGVLARCHECFNWQHLGSFQQMIPFYFLIIFN